jgi:hypothetical protein
MSAVAVRARGCPKRRPEIMPLLHASSVSSRHATSELDYSAGCNGRNVSPDRNENTHSDSSGI